MRGLVTADATTSFTQLVDIPRTSTLDFANDRLSGRGREYGFLLRPVSTSSNAPVWFDVASGHCTARGCGNHGVYGVAGQVGDNGLHSGAVPAGRYRLYVIADGRPVHIQFLLRGGGRTRLSGHRTPWQPSIVQPAATDAGPLLTTYAAGTNLNVGRYGGWVHLVSWKVLVAPASANDVGACATSSGQWAGKPYQLPCSVDGLNVGQLDGQGDDDQNASTPVHYSDFETGGIFPPGQIDYGAFNNGETPATEAHTQITVVNFPPN